MSSRRCPRMWQAEAVLDQRLSGEDRASFERHLPTCEHCARELGELSRLKELGQRLPWPQPDPLQRRRMRNELLRRAHAGDEAPRVSLRARSFLALAALALVLGWFGYHKLRAVAPAAPLGPVFEVEARAGSDWRQLRGGEAVRLQLASGEVKIHVSSLKAGQSFILILPDGDLEVRGTRFTVAAGAAGTERVMVSEGRVALRISGRPELVLSAGDSWQSGGVLPAPSAAVPVPAQEPAAPRPKPRARSSASAPSTQPAASSSAAPRSDALDSSPATDFALAMASFSRGDFATAEQLFLRFEARYPRSSQVEDSLFLRAVSRLRRGDRAGARSLSNEYLRRYPSGFRAGEAEQLLNSP